MLYLILKSILWYDSKVSLKISPIVSRRDISTRITPWAPSSLLSRVEGGGGLELVWGNPCILRVFLQITTGGILRLT